jgi:hypothetical protein
MLPHLKQRNSSVDNPSGLLDSLSSHFGNPQCKQRLVKGLLQYHFTLKLFSHLGHFQYENRQPEIANATIQIMAIMK